MVFHRILHDKRLLHLYWIPWHVAEADFISIAEKIKAVLLRHLKHRIVILCNEENAVSRFLAAGVEALFCHQNAFVNENIFNVFPRTEKRYDAIYNATMCAYKRHTLASGIKSLMLITYRQPGNYSSEYESGIRAKLRHAFWVNDLYKDKSRIPIRELPKFYNMSKVGLCLSEIEGAMFASMEYLLCGLPVVSTPSLGGRDVFWDDEYVIVAKPDAGAISKAVQKLVRRQIDPRLIREKTMQKIKEHRMRFKELCVEEGAGDIDIPWNTESGHTMDWINLRQLAERLRRG